MLVLDVDTRRNVEVGCMTTVRQVESAPKKTRGLDDVRTLHFDLVKVSPLGKATWSGSDAEISLPLDGMPPWELGYFIEAPTQPLVTGGSWIVRKSGQPIIKCSIAGSERLANLTCAKVVCEQESQNWSAKTIATPAWSCVTTAWIGPKDGIAQRVSREFLIRSPGAEKPERKVVVRYDQISSVRFHGPIFQERVDDFRAAQKAQSEMEAALAAYDRGGKQKLTTIKADIDLVLGKTYSTPYRPALKQLAQRCDLAIAGYRSIPSTNATALRVGNAVGRKAKFFTVRCVETGQTIRLKDIAQQPTLLVFLDPSTDLSVKALETAVRAAETHGAKTCKVLAVCHGNNEDAMAALRTKVQGNYLICSGKAIDKTQGVDSLPHILYIDREGIVRASHAGLGPDVGPDLARVLTESAKPAVEVGEKKGKTYLR